MDHQEASQILIKLISKPELSQEEKTAVETAIGVLAWTSLAKSKIKAMGNKYNKFSNAGIRKSAIKKRR